VFVYNTGNTIYESPANLVKLSDLDIVAALLSIASIPSLLVGLSLAGSLYEWKDWQAIVPVIFGSLSLLLFVGRELYPVSSWWASREGNGKSKPFLGLNLLKGPEVVTTFVGALFLGVLVSVLSGFHFKFLSLTLHRCIVCSFFFPSTSKSSSNILK
jgi:hypothetical protein